MTDLDATWELPTPFQPVVAIQPPRSPLFRAALELLKHGHDRTAIMLSLRDAYPHSSMADLDRTLRECAVLFAASGVMPVTDPAQAGRA